VREEKGKGLRVEGERREMEGTDEEAKVVGSRMEGKVAGVGAGRR
jgi:hypothetical protein